MELGSSVGASHGTAAGAGAATLRLAGTQHALVVTPLDLQSCGRLNMVGHEVKISKTNSTAYLVSMGVPQDVLPSESQAL